MCGISGIVSNKPNDKCHSRIKDMANYLNFRGPDNLSIWKSECNRVSFAHNRLSIIDLNSRANQPFHYKYGDFTIIYNGEIYNFNELKDRYLKDFKFLTSSDTEVLLYLYIKFKEKMFDYLQGMFAFAIFDKKENEIILARDAYGIKPLYYSFLDGRLVFASQVKAILESRLTSTQKCIEGQQSFFLLGSVIEPYTWFNDIKSLKSGSFIKYKFGDKLIEKNFSQKFYNCWERNDYLSSSDEMQRIITSSVKKSIKKHLISDVPVGIFLSSGIDSSVLAYNIAEVTKNIKGITIGYDEYKDSINDEIDNAKKICKVLGISHYAKIISHKDFENDLNLILSSMDTPTIDGLNVWYASKFAKELNLKVVLSGIGGDELFCGYPSFKNIPFSLSLKQILLSLHIPFSIINKILKLFIKLKFLPSRLSNIEYLINSPHGLYWIQRGLNELKDIHKILNKTDFTMINEAVNEAIFLERFYNTNASNLLSKISFLESNFYLRNQLLKDSDWASMSHSIELRTPFVDTELLNDVSPFINRIDPKLNKINLVNTSSVKIPSYIYNRNKTGFGIPLKEWIKKSSLLNSQYNFFRGGDRSFYKNWALFVSDNIYDNF